MAGAKKLCNWVFFFHHFYYLFIHLQFTHRILFISPLFSAKRSMWQKYKIKNLFDLSRVIISERFFSFFFSFPFFNWNVKTCRHEIKKNWNFFSFIYLFFLLHPLNIMKMHFNSLFFICLYIFFCLTTQSLM